MSYDGTNWSTITGVLGADLSLSNEGLLFAVDTTGNVWRIVSESANSWMQITGQSALQVSVSAYSQPWLVGSDTVVYSTSKLGFN